LSAHALLAGLRRHGDEAQLTQALASLACADEVFRRALLRLIVSTAGTGIEPPSELDVTAEEVGDVGRFDLRFRALDWDVIVELKIHAGYGRGQLRRYLSALDLVSHAYLVAITRDVPLYGEPPLGEDPRWIGSVRWRALLPALRRLPFADESLRAQWPLFLDVLELEGSMGFTRPDPKLFATWSFMRQATNHVEGFVEAVRWPVLHALRDVLGGSEAAADFYRGRGGRPVLSRSAWGKADMPIRVPASGPLRLRVGVFGYDPPTRFYVTPHNGRRWVTSLAALPPEGRRAVSELVERGFRDNDLHAFLELTEERLASAQLEEEVVQWAHDRFVDIRESGLLTVPEPARRRGELNEEDY